ncbi:MAG: hypothetical protein JOY51_05580 [Nevskia sp.]|nr:hypothetical protein [Nevskia sp.]
MGTGTSGIITMMALLALNGPAAGQAPAASPVGLATSLPSPVTPTAIGDVVEQPRAVVEGKVPAALAEAVNRYDGLAWAGRLSANGNRDVAVLVPRGSDLARPLELIVFFHGMGGDAAIYTGWMGRFALQLPAHGRNAIMVLPTGPHDYDRWMSPRYGEYLTHLQDQATAAASRLAGRPLVIGSYTVEGFSAGGAPVANAALSGQLRAQRINMFDASGAEIVARHKPRGATLNVFYTRANDYVVRELKGMKGITLEQVPGEHGEVPERAFFR